MSIVSPAAETARYVDSLGAAALARAAAYTAGEEALMIAGVAVSIFIAWLMIRLRLLDRIAARMTARSWLVATFAIGLAFFVVSDAIRLPWTVFVNWQRERDYGLSSQPLGDFLGQAALSSLISGLFGALFIVGIYWLIGRAGRRWWLWAGGFTALVTTAMLLLAPTLIAPLFNEYEPVPPGQVRTALEEIADRTGIPHDHIYMYDGSRQSDIFTANVAGIGPSARIAISDVALDKASLDEVKVVTAHEAGHYTLGHVWRHIVVLPLLAFLVLALIDRLFAPAARLLGSSAALGDPVGLPVFMALVSCLSLLTVPLVNSLTRIGEAQADAYALETTRLPDALASALLKTAEYRYPRPHPLQEAIFYNHPSVENRIRAAMEWKAAHRGETAGERPGNDPR